MSWGSGEGDDDVGGVDDENERGRVDGLSCIGDRRLVFSASTL